MCEPYLKSTGLFLNIVGGASEGVVPWVKGTLWPKFLGGTPRRYKILGLVPGGNLQREVVRWVNEELIKEVVIDSEYEMEDVIKVSVRRRGHQRLCAGSHVRFVEEETNRQFRHMKSWKRNGRRERL